MQEQNRQPEELCFDITEWFTEGPDLLTNIITCDEMIKHGFTSRTRKQNVNR